VKDTGPGLDDESRLRVFEPFFSRQALGIGSGLGLAMVYGVIRGHGGEISAESAPEAGTTFRAFLPAATLHTQHPTPVQGSTIVPRDGSRRALVVDDEVMVRRGIARLLEQLGYEAVEASGGKEAIEIFRTESGRFDLVVLDLMMPQMSGEETFRDLAAIDPAVRVLVSSGYSQDEHAHAIMRAGARVFLQKPYDLDQLRSAVARALAG
jgi:CheY-like chemotaxis protein